MRFFHLSISSLIAFLLSSCLYSPDDTNWVEKKSPENVEFSLNLSDYSDTIPIVRNSQIDFEFDVGLHQIYLIEVKIDQYILDYDQNPGTINFDFSKLEDGFHSLKLDIYTNSGSGSLADKAGQEMLYGTFEYTLHVSLGPPSPVLINDFSEDSGLLKISWEKFEGIGFKYYELYRLRDSNYEYFISRIEDVDQNFCYDSGYVGGDAQYLLILWTQSGQFSKSPWSKVHDDTPSIKIFDLLNPEEPIQNHRYKVSWSECKYYEAFDFYILDSRGCFGPERKIINSMDSTNIIFDIPVVGEPMKFTLTTVPKNKEYTQDFPTKSFFDLELADSIISFMDLDYFPASDLTIQTFGYTEDLAEMGLAVVTYMNENEIARKEYSYMELSGNIGLTSTSEDVIIYTPTEIQILDPLNLALKQKVLLSDISISDTYIIEIKSSTNDLHLISSGKNNPYEISTHTVVDMNTNTAIGSFNHSDSISFIDLSRNGEYLMLNNSVYKIINEGINLIGSIPEYWSQDFVHLTGSNTIIALQYKTLRTIRCNDLTVINELHFEKQYGGYKVFPDSDKLIFSSDCHLYVFDLQNHSFESDLNFNGSSNSVQRLYMVGDYFYSALGYKFEYVF